MPSSRVLPRAGFGLLGLGRVLARRLCGDLVGFFEGALQHDVAFLELGAAGFYDFDTLAGQVVTGAEAEFVRDFAGEELGVAGVFDLYLTQHLVQDDFDVLVVDLHAL